MKQKRFALLALAAVIGAVGGVFVSQGGARMVAPPPQPAWLSGDGQVDPSHLDESIPLGDASGRPLVCGGHLMTIKLRDMLGPPPAPAGASLTSSAGQPPNSLPALPAPGMSGGGALRGAFLQATALRPACGARGQLSWQPLTASAAAGGPGG